MRKTGGLLFSVLLAASVALAGCGDDDSDDTSVTTASTINPTQTSVPVGPNTTSTLAGPTTTGG
jgi:hypothetical protein